MAFSVVLGLVMAAVASWLVLVLVRKSHMTQCAHSYLDLVGTNKRECCRTQGAPDHKKRNIASQKKRAARTQWLEVFASSAGGFRCRRSV